MKAVRLYLILYLIGLSLATAYRWHSEKGHFLLGLNPYRNDFADTFFSWVTHAGDAWAFVAVITIALLVRHWNAAFFLSLTGVAVGITSWVLKTQIFPHAMRPIAYFPRETLMLVEGVEVLEKYSFPSGHTMTVFAWTLACSLYLRRPWIQFLLFLLAFFTALSRVYLNQHFLEDVIVGSILGVLWALGINHWGKPHLMGSKFYSFKKKNIFD
jgi:membrane-associated phospholipid phosphatase